MASLGVTAALAAALLLACVAVRPEAAPALAPGFGKEIAPGVFLPYVSLGHPDDNSSEAADLDMWLRLGGVGIDTAWIYRNQRAVADGLARSGRARASVFVTTKIPCVADGALALEFIREDLKELRMDYVDLLLLHEPCETKAGTALAWRAIQLAASAGLARAVGVSNFAPRDLDAVLAAGGVPPSVNQCRMSIGYRDGATLAYCAARGITYQAYSPLRHVDLADPCILAIAKAHGRSSAQVALRWVVQQGVPVATSPGASAKFSQQDLELDSFALSALEMATLSALGAPAFER
jgi:diketogulonate reductase-like aldo/keto reductase